MSTHFPRTTLLLAAALSLLSGCAGLPGLEVRIGYPPHGQQQQPGGPVGTGWQTAAGLGWTQAPYGQPAYGQPPYNQPAYGQPAVYAPPPNCGCQAQPPTTEVALPPVQWH